MANLSISGIRDRIFNTTKHEQTVARSSNPFAASSFKGNVLTADVFESKKNQPGFTANVPAKSKLVWSALVGSLSNMGNKFHSGVESILAFGRRMKDSVSNFWTNMQETSIELSFVKKMDEQLALAGSKIKNTAGLLKSKLSSSFETPMTYKNMEISKVKDAFINEKAIAETAHIAA